MNSFPTLLAALALIVPAPPAAVAPVAPETGVQVPVPKMRATGPEAEAIRNFRDSFRPETQRQVHIEQRVIIRITPSPPSVRREIFDAPPQADAPVRYKEKKFGHCVAIDDIAGISPLQPNRLLLFMRDHRMLSASLERACAADAFYLGAYVERGADGKLCTGRDTLRARTGATCRLSKINRLVMVRD